MNREQIVIALKAYFPDWDITTNWNELVSEVISAIGVKAIDRFALFDWQGQDNIINVLQAIRGQ